MHDGCFRHWILEWFAKQQSCYSKLNCFLNLNILNEKTRPVNTSLWGHSGNARAKPATQCAPSQRCPVPLTTSERWSEEKHNESVRSNILFTFASQMFICATGMCSHYNCTSAFLGTMFFESSPPCTLGFWTPSTRMQTVHTLSLCYHQLLASYIFIFYPQLGSMLLRTVLAFPLQIPLRSVF